MLAAVLEPLQVGDLLKRLCKDDEGQNVLSRKQKYRECCPSISGMALGRGSCLWLPSVQTVMVNNRPRERGRWHFLILEIAVPCESFFYLGNSGSQQLPGTGTPFSFLSFWHFSERDLFVAWLGGVARLSIPHSPPLCRQEPSSLAAGARVVVCKRHSTICAIRLFPNKPGSCKPYQLWLIVKGRGKKRKLLGPASFRQAGSGGNKRKPLTNHSIILILSEKRARDG